MQLRKKIIASALELFETKGYNKTTIESIIQRAECSKGGFYHHFKSKDEILEEIVQQEINILKDYLSQIGADTGGDFVTGFDEVYKHIISYKINQLSDTDKISNIFVFSGNERILLKINELFQSIVYKIYLDVIERAIKSGEIEIEYRSQVAQLCTRQVMWLLESAHSMVFKNNDNDISLEVEFGERLIGQSLHLARDSVHYRKETLRYIGKLNDVKKNYKEDDND